MSEILKSPIVRWILILAVTLGGLYCLNKVAFYIVPGYRTYFLNRGYSQLDLPLSNAISKQCSGGDMVDNQYISCSYSYRLAPTTRVNIYDKLKKYLKSEGYSVSDTKSIFMSQPASQTSVVAFEGLMASKSPHNISISFNYEPNPQLEQTHRFDPNKSSLENELQQIQNQPITKLYIQYGRAF